MKVLNLTGGPAEKLAPYAMENHTIAVGDFVFEPNKAVDVPPEKEAHIRALLEHFITIGAVGIDVEEPPPLDRPESSEPLPRSPPTARSPRRLVGG